MTDEVRKSLPAEQMAQKYYERESEIPDKYDGAMRAQEPVAKQRELKASTDDKALDEEVGGVSLEEGKGAGEKEDYADIMLKVDSLETARKDIEMIVRHLEGKIIRTEYFKDRQVMSIMYNASKTRQLLEQLRIIGEIGKSEVQDYKDTSIALSGAKDYRQISIEIVEK
jgi:hypothetical protein